MKTPRKPVKFGSPTQKPIPHILFVIDPFEGCQWMVLQTLLYFHTRIDPMFSWGFQIGQRMWEFDGLSEKGLKQLETQCSETIGHPPNYRSVLQTLLKTNWSRNPTVAFQTPLVKAQWNQSGALKIRNYVFLVTNELIDLKLVSLKEQMQHLFLEWLHTDIWNICASARVGLVWLTNNTDTALKAFMHCIARVYGGGLVDFTSEHPIEEMLHFCLGKTYDNNWIKSVFEKQSLDHLLKSFDRPFVGKNPNVLLSGGLKGIPISIVGKPSFQLCEGSLDILGQCLSDQPFNRDGLIVPRLENSIQALNDFCAFEFDGWMILGCDIKEMNENLDPFVEASYKDKQAATIAVRYGPVPGVWEWMRVFEYEDLEPLSAPLQIPILDGSSIWFKGWPKELVTFLSTGRVLPNCSESIYDWCFGIWHPEACHLIQSPVSKKKSVPFQEEEPESLVPEYKSLQDAKEGLKAFYLSTIYSKIGLTDMIETVIPSVYEQIEVILSFYQELIMPLGTLEKTHTQRSKQLLSLIDVDADPLPINQLQLARTWLAQLQLVIFLECLRLHKQNQVPLPSLNPEKNKKWKEKHYVEFRLHYQEPLPEIAKIFLGKIDLQLEKPPQSPFFKKQRKETSSDPVVKQAVKKAPSKLSHLSKRMVQVAKPETKKRKQSSVKKEIQDQVTLIDFLSTNATPKKPKILIQETPVGQKSAMLSDSPLGSRLLESPTLSPFKSPLKGLGTPTTKKRLQFISPSANRIIKGLQLEQGLD
ncbi:hypothetical protein EDD86DRAFT_246614 [Gorgonomyces haynaldii]|nr:hypothetical protein EDD86DRAFT_246614 [Gorgonomyces haynaldii]